MFPSSNGQAVLEKTSKYWANPPPPYYKFYRVKIDPLNLFFLPFSIGTTKWFDILDLTMVWLDLSFKTIKSKKKFFSRRLSDRVGWSSGGPSLKTSKIFKDLPSIIKEVYSHKVLHNSKDSERVVEKQATFLRSTTSQLIIKNEDDFFFSLKLSRL
jgi:hypothetical protein